MSYGAKIDKGGIAMKTKSYMRKSILSSNKGFSLVELLVVVAIMAVATGLVSITYTLITNANVSKAANTLDTAFNKARVESMAKGPDAGQLTVWSTSGILYYTIGDPATETPIAVNNASTDFWCHVGGSIYPPNTDIPPMIYRFNSAGIVMPSSWISDYYEFSNGNRRVDVIFYLDTGKHTTKIYVN